jgi:hypothetical protein
MEDESLLPSVFSVRHEVRPGVSGTWWALLSVSAVVHHRKITAFIAVTP